MSEEKKFRLNAKNVFLTYSRTPEGLDKPALAGFLSLLEPAPSYYRIAKERHRDGTPHLHALLLYDRKVNIRNARHYDFMGCHPNVGAARDVKGSFAYLTKDDEHPLDTPGIAAVVGGGKRGRDRERERRRFIDLARQGQIEEAREDFINQHPKDYLINRTRIEESFTQLAPKSRGRFLEGSRQPEDFVWDQRKALHLWGPTNRGKTNFAKSLSEGDFILISHLDQLKDLKGEAYIIFDDLSFVTYDITTCIHLCDTENDRAIHCRYNPARIPAGTRRIFTSNPREIWPLDPDGALARRLYQYQVKDYLYARAEEEEAAEGRQESEEDRVPETPPEMQSPRPRRGRVLSDAVRIAAQRAIDLTHDEDDEPAIDPLNFHPV